MRNIKELNLTVSNDKERLNINNYLPGYSGNMLKSADSAFSQRLQTVHKEEESEEDMNNDDIILEMAYNECLKSYRQKRLSQELIITTACTDPSMNEGVVGAVYETGKAYIQDIVKNLLSTAAIALSSGFAGDTIVDILYALKRTKDVIDIYQGIMDSAGILKDFFAQLNNIQLENNVEEIKNFSHNLIIDLAYKNKDLIDSIGDSEIYQDASQSLSDLYDSGKEYIGNLLETVKKYIMKLKEEFISFLKSSNKAIGDYIGAFIPDDFGAGSAIYKGIINEIINTTMENSLTIFLSIKEKLPDSFENIIFSESALEEYVTEALEAGQAAAADFFDTSDDGMIKKFFKYQSPAYHAAKAGFDYLDLENMSVEEHVKPSVGMFSQVMKYSIAFFSIMEGLSTGELQEKIANYNEAQSQMSNNLAQADLDKKYSIGDIEIGSASDYLSPEIQDAYKQLYEMSFLDKRKKVLL